MMDAKIVTRRRILPVALLLPLLLVGQPCLAQQLGTARPIEVPVIQLVAGLVLCSLAAFAIILVLKRRGGGPGAAAQLLNWRARGRMAARAIRVIETQRLSVHADICRFIAADREYLVIVSPGAATVLSNKPAPISPAPPDEGADR